MARMQDVAGRLAKALLWIAFGLMLLICVFTLLVGGDLLVWLTGLVTVFLVMLWIDFQGLVKRVQRLESQAKR